MVDGYLLKSRYLFWVLCIKKQLDFVHCLVIIWMAKNISNFALKAFITKFEHNLFGLQFLYEISHKCRVLPDSKLVLLKPHLILLKVGCVVENVIHKSDCEDLLLVVLKLD